MQCNNPIAFGFHLISSIRQPIFFVVGAFLTAAVGVLMDAADVQDIVCNQKQQPCASDHEHIKRQPE